MPSNAYYPADRVEITPSGVRVEFFDKHAKTDDLPGQRRFYRVDGEELISVSTVLNLLDKPALQSWSHKIGIEGAIQLAQEGDLPQDLDQAISFMARRGLCYWQVRDKASERGTLAHDEVVKLAAGEVPDIGGFPVELRGYVQGLCSWYADFRPQVVQQEFMVASPLHGFVGRADMLAELKTPTYQGLGLIDFKTVEKLPRDKRGNVKPPYREHCLQLAAYDLAARECGYGRSGFQLIVRVDAKGAYDVARSWAQEQDFLAVLGAYRQLKDFSARSRQAA